MNIKCLTNTKSLFGNLEIGFYYRIGNKIYVKCSKDSAIDLETQDLKTNINDDLGVEEIEITKLEYILI